MKRIVLTGGGTAGHVTPHLALIPHLRQRGWEVHYLGAQDGIERQLVGSQLPYYPISAGKLRRYFSWRNLSDPFRVIKGVADAYRHLRRIQPSIVFSKGGFVAVPVSLAAWLLRIPVILHESDLTPGLANRLCAPFARKLCVAFPDSLNYLKGGAARKAVVTGTPIREELLKGSREKGLAICGFSDRRPVLLVIGGSLGSALLNRTIRENLAQLTGRYQIIHICGRGNPEPEMKSPGYYQLEYAGEELPHLLAAADLVLSRAGANAIVELVALAKPNVLVPLSRRASRGDQILNAASFARQGLSLVIQEEELNGKVLHETLGELEKDRERFIAAMQSSPIKDGTSKILNLIEEEARRG